MNWIADGLTRIRNAIILKKPSVTVRGTKVFLQILQVMQDQKFIESFEKNETNLKQSYIVYLKYFGNKSVIRGLKLKSNHIKADEINVYLKKFSCPIITTNEGILSGKHAIERNLGGKMLCEVF